MRIPVGYTMKPVDELKVGDVVYTEGKIIDVYITEEDEEWEGPAGRIYLLPAVVYYTASVIEGQVIERRAPALGAVRVLRYAYTMDGPKPRSVRKKKVEPKN